MALLQRAAAAAGVVGIALALTAGETVSGQTGFRTGQDVTPAFDGWEANPDGSFNLVFGYFNRNLDEEIDIPIGPNNNVEPGGPDQGQPTHFYPRRNRYSFRIKVPKDFGTKEVAWTLISKGKTNKTYGTLKAEYITDPELQQFDVGDFGHNNEKLRDNKRPELSVEGGDAVRTVKVGEPLSLTAIAKDDGKPPVLAAPVRLVGRHDSWGLRVTWLVYRGVGKNVTFNPPQFQSYPDYRIGSNSPWTPGWTPPPVPPDGKFPVKMTFSAPGTYVVRVLAHDGGLDASRDVTINVTDAAASSASSR